MFMPQLPSLTCPNCRAGIAAAEFTGRVPIPLKVEVAIFAPVFAVQDAGNHDPHSAKPFTETDLHLVLGTATTAGLDLRRPHNRSTDYPRILMPSSASVCIFALLGLALILVVM
jgi:hypothetical protein